MRLPNSYGSISKLPGKRRRPYRIQVTTGWELDPDSDTLKQKRKTIGYTATKSEALNILSDYHNNPYDIDASKATFKDVYMDISVHIRAARKYILSFSRSCG